MAKCAVTLFLGHPVSFPILAFKNISFSFSVSVFLSLFLPPSLEGKKKTKQVFHVGTCNCRNGIHAH